MWNIQLFNKAEYESAIYTKNLEYAVAGHQVNANHGLSVKFLWKSIFQPLGEETLYAK